MDASLVASIMVVTAIIVIVVVMIAAVVIRWRWEARFIDGHIRAVHLALYDAFPRRQVAFPLRACIRLIVTPRIVGAPAAGLDRRHALRLEAIGIAPRYDALIIDVARLIRGTIRGSASLGTT
jgi:hypothetical protein